MTVEIREGSLEDVVSVLETIEEFSQKESVATLSARLGNKPQLILVAEKSGNLLGFKIGYALNDTTFYSWFGGVSSQARGEGVAQHLLEEQERWVISQGYTTLRVKSRNQYPSMLRLLIRNGYFIESVEQKSPLIESRIHFIKMMSLT